MPFNQVGWVSAHALERLVASPAKRVVLSGPSGFLGSRVLDGLVDAMSARKRAGVEPGSIVLLSSSPGHLMGRLHRRYNKGEMALIRASRVNYYSQHSEDTWVDQLGAMLCGGPDSVFVNLAAVAGPRAGQPTAMMDVNYHGAIAAARACHALHFGHFVQSSTQATAAERAGQVPYSKHKSMADFALGRIVGMPVTIASLGLLYSERDVAVGQDRDDRHDWQAFSLLRRAVKLNLIDLSLLPLTPIMGTGDAPLQPQEVSDAAHRLCFLALTEPAQRPVQESHPGKGLPAALQKGKPDLRFYDAVGPETVSIVELLERFAHYQGKTNFKPVFIDYRHMEEVLNVQSLGNLNRQFVSLLRSEQQAPERPLVGQGDVWDSLLEDSPMLTLDDAFAARCSGNFPKRRYPYVDTLRFVAYNPRVVWPGIKLSVEILHSWLTNRGPSFSTSEH